VQPPSLTPWRAPIRQCRQPLFDAGGPVLAALSMMSSWVAMALLAATAACSSQDAVGPRSSSEGRPETKPADGGAGRSVGLAQPSPTPERVARPALPKLQPEPPTDLARSDCRASNAPQHFFPARAFFAGSNATPVDEFMASWYSRALLLAREASLSCSPPSKDAYRLLILRSGPFTEVPIDVVHIQVDDDQGSVSIRRLRGDRDLRVGRSRTVAQRQLSHAEVDRLLRQVQKSNFWSMPRNEDLRLRCSVTLWLLEARSHDRYRVVQGLSPLDGEFRMLCDVVAELGGLSCR
jgi:hypothetical protein